MDEICTNKISCDGSQILCMYSTYYDNKRCVFRKKWENVCREKMLIFQFKYFMQWCVVERNPFTVNAKKGEFWNNNEYNIVLFVYFKNLQVKALVSKLEDQNGISFTFNCQKCLTFNKKEVGIKYTNINFNKKLVEFLNMIIDHFIPFRNFRRTRFFIPNLRF